MSRRAEPLREELVGLAYRLKRAREAKKYTVEYVAVSSNISYDHLRRLENQKTIVLLLLSCFFVLPILLVSVWII